MEGTTAFHTMIIEAFQSAAGEIWPVHRQHWSISLIWSRPLKVPMLKSN